MKNIYSPIISKHTVRKTDILSSVTGILRLKLLISEMKSFKKKVKHCWK